MENNVNKYSKLVQSNDEQIIDISALWNILLGKWYWFIISILISVSIAGIYLYRTPKVFRQNATIMVKDRSAMGGAVSGAASAFSDMVGLNMISSSNTDNEMMILQSRSLMESVVVKMNFYITYYKENKFRWTELYEYLPFRIIETFPGRSIPKEFKIEILSESQYKYSDSDTIFISEFNKNIDFPFGNAKIESYPEILDSFIGDKIKVNINSIDRTVASYLNSLYISLMSKTSTMVSLSFNSSRPAKAKDVLNCILDQYCYRSILDKNMVLENTSLFIAERLEFIKAELTNVDDIIERYKSTNRTMSTSTESGVYLKSATELEEKISANDLQIELVNILSEFINNSSNRRELLPYNIGLNNDVINKQIQEYNENLIKLNRLISASSERNPLVIDLNLMLESTRSNIVNAIKDQKKSLKLLQKELEIRNIRTTGRIEAVSVNERNIQTYTRDQKIKEELYLYLLNKAEESAITKSMTEANAMIVDRAGGNNYPLAPKKSMIILASMMIGFIIPAIWFILKDLFNNKVRGRADVNKIISAPILGEIPSIKNKNKKVDEMFVIEDGETTHISESFRLVRTNLTYLQGDNKIIAVTSTQAAEGKTYISANLAKTLSFSNKKVCLIDLDLRRRSLSKKFKLNKSKGVSDFLSNKINEIGSLSQLIENENKNLFIIPAGAMPPNPAELLMSERFNIMIKQLREEFDYIIIDNPPVNIVADTRISNRCADITLYVIRAGVIDRRELISIQERYENKELNNLNIIITDVDYEALYYSIGYNGYEKGYGYSYVQKGKYNKYYN